MGVYSRGFNGCLFLFFIEWQKRLCFLSGRKKMLQSFNQQPPSKHQTTLFKLTLFNLNRKGTCSTEQIKSLKIDLNEFLQSILIITAERGIVERLHLFFSAQNLLLQRKYWRNKSKMKKESNQKARKNAQNPSKTAEKRPKTG